MVMVKEAVKATKEICKAFKEFAKSVVKEMRMYRRFIAGLVFVKLHPFFIPFATLE